MVFPSISVADHLLVTARVAASLLLIGVSAQILVGLFGGPGLRGFARRAELLGMHASMPFAVCAGLSAGVSGVALLVGGLFSVAALTLIGFMVVAAHPLWGTNAGEPRRSLLETLLAVVVLLSLADNGWPFESAAADYPYGYTNDEAADDTSGLATA